MIQHLEIDKSLIQKHTIIHPRRTPYFIDYLEELNISYDEAWKEENRAKLVDLLQRKFK